MKRTIAILLLLGLCAGDAFGVAYVSDTFTGTDTTALPSHTGETGATWTNIGGSSAIEIVSNRIRNTTAGLSEAYASGTHIDGEADLDVDVDYFAQTAASVSYAAVRVKGTTASQTGYGLFWDAGKWSIYEGAAVRASGSAFTVNNTTTYHVRGTFRKSGTDMIVTLYVDGVQQCTYTDTSPTTGNRVALQFFAGSGGWRLDNLVVDDTVPARDSYAVNNAGLLWSPYNWYFSGSTYAQSTNPGAYLKTNFTGRCAVLTVDVSANGSYPKIAYSIDGGAFVDRTLNSSSGSLVLANGLTTGSHTLVVWFDNIGRTDRWTTPTDILRVTGVQIEAGYVLSAPTTPTRRIILYGDSITEGYSSLPGPLHSARVSYGALLSASLNADIGIIGFASQSYNVVGDGGVPVCQTSYPDFYSGQSRLVSSEFSPAPDAVFINHGTNGSTAAQIKTFMESMRTAAPSAKIVLIVPFGQYAASNMTTALSDYQAAHPADTKVYKIDTGVDYDNTGAYTTDGLHPSVSGHQAYHDGLLPLLQALFPGKSSLLFFSSQNQNQ